MWKKSLDQWLNEIEIGTLCNDINEIVLEALSILLDQSGGHGGDCVIAVLQVLIDKSLETFGMPIGKKRIIICNEMGFFKTPDLKFLVNDVVF